MRDGSNCLRPDERRDVQSYCVQGNDDTGAVLGTVLAALLGTPWHCPCGPTWHCPWHCLLVASAVSFSLSLAPSFVLYLALPFFLSPYGILWAIHFKFFHTWQAAALSSSLSYIRHPLLPSSLLPLKEAASYFGFESFSLHF